MTEPAASEASPEESEAQPPAPREVRLRRAPNHVRFVITGVVLGVLIALIASTRLPAVPEDMASPGAVTAYMASLGGFVGGIIGATLAVLADRRR